MPIEFGESSSVEYGFRLVRLDEEVPSGEQRSVRYDVILDATWENWSDYWLVVGIIHELLAQDEDDKLMLLFPPGELTNGRKALEEGV